MLTWSMWQEHPVLLMVGSPDDVTSRVTDTEMEAPEALASKLPWSRMKWWYLTLQSPCTETPAPDRLHVRPRPGLTLTDVVGGWKPVT